MRLSLDSNVVVYAYDLQAGPRHELAVELLQRAAGSDCVLAVQCLAEFFFVSTQKGKLRVSVAAAAVDEIRQSFPCCVAGEAALRAAISAVRQHRLPFWDAMLWATVQEAGCEILLSEDLQDGRKLGAVTFVNPFDPRNRVLVDRVLPSVP